MRTFSILGLFVLTLAVLFGGAHADNDYDNGYGYGFGGGGYGSVYDFIVLGGGGAGCVVGHDLANSTAGYRVLVLEKGIGADTSANSVDNDLNSRAGYTDGPNERHYYAGPQQFANLRKVWFPTYEGIGGGTRIYGATAVIPSKEWFDQKMPTGYKYNDMLPVIKGWQDHACNYQSQNDTGVSPVNCAAFHGKGGPMSIGSQHRASVTQPIKDLLDVARSVIGDASDYNGGGSRAGATYEEVYKRLANQSDPASTPTKLSTWAAFLPQSFQASHPNLEIRLNAKVVRLLYSRADRNRVIGAEYVVGNNSAIRRVFALHEVVTSLGVIGTPRFLQANGIGPADLIARIGATLRADNPAVGANLTAHQGFLMAYKLNTSLTHDLTHWSRNVIDFFIKSNFTSLPADVQVSVLEGLYAESMTPEDFTPGKDLAYSIQHLVDTGDFVPLVTRGYEKYVGLVVFNVDPLTVGSVNASSVDIDKNPSLDYGWTEANIQGSGDLLKLRHGLSVIRKIMLNTTFTSKYQVKEIVPGPQNVAEVAAFYPELSGAALQDKADELFMRMQFSHLFHVTGSCRLGQCTDLDGRVKGVKRLRVCDNSLLPQPDGNPTGAMITVCREIVRRILADAAAPLNSENRPQYNYFDC